MTHSAYIQAIETAVPETAFDQTYIQAFMQQHVARDRAAQLIVKRVYQRSGIQKRHSVIREFSDAPSNGLFFDADARRVINPPTGDRNRRYEEEAKALMDRFVPTLFQNANVDPREVTHLITVSCTGFFAPGPECHLIRALNLAPDIPAYHIGFMGCYASFPAMRMARHILSENPNALVLIVCVELCTLHLQFSEDRDALVAASLFADGAAAVLIGSQPRPTSSGALRIDELHTSRIPEGEHEMAWTIGNHGFDMVLSPDVPRRIEAFLPNILASHAMGVSLEQLKHWAIHPGGRAILDAVQKAAHLPDTALDASRAVLRDFGNMSSATIWFVLKHILDHAASHEQPLLAMAFGPGLTVESSLLSICPATLKEHVDARLAIYS